MNEAEKQRRAVDRLEGAVGSIITDKLFLAVHGIKKAISEFRDDNRKRPIVAETDMLIRDTRREISVYVESLACDVSDLFAIAESLEEKIVAIEKKQTNIDKHTQKGEQS